MYRLTGTLAGQVLLRDNQVRDGLGLSRNSNDNHSPLELLSSLCNSWFSTSRSTESMMRGTGNESAVLAALSRKHFVVGVFEVGMVGVKDSGWIACSPDAMALIDLSRISTPLHDGRN